jgi:hypothetical protein
VGLFTGFPPRESEQQTLRKKQKSNDSANLPIHSWARHEHGYEHA